MSLQQILIVGLLAPTVVALIALVAGALLSLDFRRGHARATAALPTLDDAPSAADGLYRIRASGMEFRARIANLGGTGDGVILLHGFPQTSASWQALVAALADQGCRVVAFDQRGYSPGARPAGLGAYALDRLVDDVIAVADAVGFRRFHLAGHDWGSAVGWSVLIAHPGRVLSWAGLSIAHPAAFGDALKGDVDQRRRSRYIQFFRWPILPELVLAFNRNLLMRHEMFRHMPAGHVAEYQAMLAEPGALTAVLNWYRAMVTRQSPWPRDPVDRPVLFIWGNRDPAAGRRAVELQRAYVRGYYRYVELDAGHWLLERQLETVRQEISAHIAAHGPREPDG